jgi:hypothetical protein
MQTRWQGLRFHDLNGYEHRLWLKTFDTVEALRLALHAFQRQDTETWLLGRHSYKAPAQVRQEQRCTLADAASFESEGVQKTVDRYSIE